MKLQMASSGKRNIIAAMSCITVGAPGKRLAIRPESTHDRDLPVLELHHVDILYAFEVCGCGGGGGETGIGR